MKEHVEAVERHRATGNSVEAVGKLTFGEAIKSCRQAVRRSRCLAGLVTPHDFYAGNSYGRRCLWREMEQSGAKAKRRGNKYSSGLAGEGQNDAILRKRPFSVFESGGRMPALPDARHRAFRPVLCASRWEIGESGSMIDAGFAMEQTA